MITVSDLKNVCIAIENEFGSDSKVCIQLRDMHGNLIDGAYCIDMFCDNAGTLFLTNHKVKNSSCEKE